LSRLYAQSRSAVRARERGLLSWHEVDADSDERRRLAPSAPPLRPVLFDPDGRVIAYGRLSAKRLRRQLHNGAAALR
jgi:hypothetical protein